MTTRLQSFGDIRLPCFVQPYPEPIQNMLRDIQQFHPIIPFQSKDLPALKRDTWFVLQRPTDKDRPRSGFLVVSNQYCVFIRNPTQIILLRIRLDLDKDNTDNNNNKQKQNTVFSATLSLSQSLLTVEDTLVWKNQSQKKERFSTRWAHVVQWMDTSCVIDPRLIGGLRIELAQWKSLDSLQSNGVWELVNECGFNQRLLWMKTHKKVIVKGLVKEKVKGKGDTIVIATRDECCGPEQWLLTSSDGKSMGPCHALVRTLAISDMLRSAQTNTQQIPVEVIWNPTFQKWEIQRILLHNTRECTERERGENNKVVP